MARASGPWLLAASLLGILAGSSAGVAQSGRGWVDPPPEAGAHAQTPAPPPSPAAQPAVSGTTAPSGQQPSTAADTRAEDTKASAAAPVPAGTSARKSASNTIVKQKPSAARKANLPSQTASSSTRRPKRNEQIVVRRRAPEVDAAQTETGSVGDRRDRFTRFGPPGDGRGPGLQLMRLRTIQLPDGRRIDVLTRPDQDITSEMVRDGY
jgi:hypothetical protein